jgi:hypothetical protein
MFFFYLKNKCYQTFFKVTRKQGKKVKHEENSRIHFCDAWSFLLVHIWFTPSHGSKGFKNALSRNRIMQVLSCNVTMERCPLTWDNFMIYDVNIPCVLWLGHLSEMGLSTQCFSTIEEWGWEGKHWRALLNEHTHSPNRISQSICKEAIVGQQCKATML